jgi:transcriptional regulator with XRE-family HTH domain
MGNKIKAKRLEKGLTIRELSKQTGIAERTLEYYEQGRDPKASFLKKIADALGCKMESLI